MIQTVRNYLFRINTANLWGAIADYDLYPKILKDIERGKVEKKYIIKKKLMEYWEHRQINDKNPHGRTANSGITEYLFGIDINKELQRKEITAINNRGVNVFDTIPYTNDVKLSDEGANLRDIYYENQSSDIWKIKLLELFLKYDLRFRALMLRILTYKYKLKYFKKKDFKVLTSSEVYLENPQFKEKIYIFKNKSEVFNQLLTENQYETIGPFLKQKFMDFYNFEISSEDNITITGFRGDPNSSVVYNQFKKLVRIMMDLDLVINDNQFFKIDTEHFTYLFPEEIIKDFLSLKAEFKKRQQKDISEEFYAVFKKYCEDYKDPIDNYIPIGKVYLKVCEELRIISEKEKEFCELFYSLLNQNKYNLISKRKGLYRLGISPCEDKKLNKWKIEFY